MSSSIGPRLRLWFKLNFSEKKNCDFHSSKQQAFFFPFLCSFVSIVFICLVKYWERVKKVHVGANRVKTIHAKIPCVILKKNNNHVLQVESAGKIDDTWVQTQTLVRERYTKREGGSIIGGGTDDTDYEREEESDRGRDEGRDSNRDSER